MTIASDVLTTTRGLLGDPDPGTTFTDIKLLPLLDLANKELQLLLFGVNALELKEIGALLTVPVNTLELNGVAGFPTDIIRPVALSERPSGSSDLFLPMSEQEWEPEVIPDETIQFWNFREGKIKVNPATSTRQVKLKYLKALTAITGIGSAIPIPQSEVWLAYKTANLAAITIGENPSRAASLLLGMARAESAIIGDQVKGGQIAPARHRRRRKYADRSNGH